MKHTMPPKDIPLVPFADFQKVVPKLLATTKRESDRQMAAFQSENAKRRARVK